MQTLPVVLIHGLGVDHRMWSLQVPHLEAVGDVWAPDLPGFGREPSLAPGDRRAVVYADWVAERLRERWPGRAACMAGYSMGGSVALLLALRHPELVERLAVACSPPWWLAGWRRVLPLLLSRPTARAAVEVFPLTARAGVRLFSRDAVLRREMDDMTRLADRDTMVALCRDLSRIDFRGRLSSVGAPTLVVAGTRDVWMPPAAARSFAEGLRDGRLVVFPGAGHLLCLSRAQELGRALAEFFAATDPHR